MFLFVSYLKCISNEKEIEPFSTAERSERVENLFFAQGAKVSADQICAGARRLDHDQATYASAHISAAERAVDQQGNNLTSIL